MATSTYLSNPVVFIGSTAIASSEITDNVSAVTVNYVVEALEDTAFGSTARTNTGGLQNNSVTLTVYASYATSETYAILAPLVGTKCYIKVTPATGANSATNPGFEITNGFLSALPVANMNLGELSTYDIEIIGGVYSVDVT